MSVKVMDLVWKMDYPNDRRFVLLALADYAHDDGTHVFPSIETLARKLRRSVRATKRAVHALKEDGLVIVEQRGGGRGRSTRYRLVLDTIRGAIPVQETVSSATPFRGRETVSSATETVSSATGNGVVHDTGTVIEPLREQEQEALAHPLTGALASSTKEELCESERLDGVGGCREPRAEGRLCERHRAELKEKSKRFKAELRERLTNRRDAGVAVPSNGSI